MVSRNRIPLLSSFWILVLAGSLVAQQPPPLTVHHAAEDR